MHARPDWREPSFTPTEHNHTCGELEYNGFASALCLGVCHNHGHNPPPPEPHWGKGDPHARLLRRAAHTFNRNDFITVPRNAVPRASALTSRPCLPRSQVQGPGAA